MDFVRPFEQEVVAQHAPLPEDTPPASPGVRCARCHLQRDCEARPLASDARSEMTFATRRHLRRGEQLFREGDAFETFGAVRSGILKTSLVTRDGREHIAAFHLSGEVVGADGLAAGCHPSSAVALEDCELCVIPVTRVDSQAMASEGLRSRILKLMTRELERRRELMLLLGSPRAEERMAAFLLSFAGRLAARGYCAVDFTLRVTHVDIARHLGVTLETVSRTFTSLRARGVIGTHGRRVRILDRAALERLARASR